MGTRSQSPYNLSCHPEGGCRREESGQHFPKKMNQFSTVLRCFVSFVKKKDNGEECDLDQEILLTALDKFLS
jgi:hypothetical protein